MNAARRMLVLGAAMGAAAAMAEWARPVADPAAWRPALDELFPRAFPGWRADEGAELLVRPTRETAREEDGGLYDQVLQRTYVDRDGRRVMLLAAEGAEQSAGLQMHRPEVCYPGNGFRVEDLHGDTLQAAARRIPCTRLLASRPGRSEPITYWTVLGERVVADAGEFRARQLRFGLRRTLLDGMLVRISSLDADREAAYALHSRFAAALAQALTPRARDKVIGSAQEGRA